MSLSIDPRGSLVFPGVTPSRAYRPVDSIRDHRRSLPVNYLVKPRSHRRICSDWILSTASNVHVAIDRSSFKTYTEFKSHVLTMSDRRQVPVKGIGTVDINFRRSPRSTEVHTISLDNVLHVPSWICNIFSDIYFPGQPLEHTWDNQGIKFVKKNDDGTFQDWAYTTDFFGVERFSVAGPPHGRSPMAEDKEREIFSVNVMWPQGQRALWEALHESE